MKKAFLWFCFSLLLVTGGVFGFEYYLEEIYIKQRLSLSSPETVTIPRGESFSGIVKRLQKEGIISYPPLFSYYCRSHKLDRSLKAGTYQFKAGMSLRDVIALLSKGVTTGKASQIRFTIIEGMTLREIAQLLGKKTGLNPQRFYALCRKGEQFPYMNRKGNLEGYLFPDTYYIDERTDEKQLINRILSNFGAKLNVLMKELNLKMIDHLDEVITLASIIEKESGVKKEMPVIASVFSNRLKRGIRLQSDPTVIYSLLTERGSFNGNITRKDLLIDSPYNTYRYKGLPPSPIANPGLNAIRAVLHPAKTSYLYFVAKGNGEHYFSKSLKEHNRAVRKYQLGGS